jgi:hypothetical protein
MLNMFGYKELYSDNLRALEIDFMHFFTKGLRDEYEGFESFPDFPDRIWIMDLFLCELYRRRIGVDAGEEFFEKVIRDHQQERQKQSKKGAVVGAVPTGEYRNKVLTGGRGGFGQSIARLMSR